MVYVNITSISIQKYTEVDQKPHRGRNNQKDQIKEAVDNLI